MEAKKQRVHFIAIGGSVMHNLAVALHNTGGYLVTGSDAAFSEPSRTRLQKAGILPANEGWFPEKISSGIDAVILGPDVTTDNPELAKARKEGVKFYSYPEFIFKLSEDKQRIVIAGSHGKTTIASIILHVLNHFNRKFDYVIGAELEGLDPMVKISEDAPVIIIEGDEFFNSPIDNTPKFLHYHHHIALISGISWDHINVYPTFDEYVKQFELLADSSPKGGVLVYSENDDLATVVCRKEREDVQRIEYSAHKHEIENGLTYLLNGSEKIPVQIFGKHNMRNISGAKALCMRIGISEEMFYTAIQSFKGAANRLELLEKSTDITIFQDFAQAPANLKASTKAVKNQFPSRDLVAVLELNSFNHLNKEFLSQYKDTFKSADEPIVFIDPSSDALKQLPAINPGDVKNAFDHPKLEIFTESDKLKNFLLGKAWKNKNLLLMSSGNFGGINVKELAKTIVGK